MFEPLFAMTDTMRKWTNAMRSRRYEAAWAIANRVMTSRDTATRDDPSLPYHQRWVWDGRRFDGRDVLVRCYHGLGDAIQFARYLPALAARARSVTLEAPPALVPLLSRIPSVSAIKPFDMAHPLPPSECDIEISELDRALRIPPEAVAGPYLYSSRAILPTGTIGICNGSGNWDPQRDVRAAMLERVCAMAPAITLMPGRSPLPVLNPRGCPLDMDVTASLVMAADLVITVDTMIAHLSGALGRPTWLMLKSQPDWRWSPDAQGSPWYPTMRLFVQSAPGEWDDVIERICTQLALRTCITRKG